MKNGNKQENLNQYNMKFKPMLAATINTFNNLKFPIFIQPKIDGIRAVLLEGKLLSRTLKPIPNKFVRHRIQEFYRKNFYLIDGELTVGDSFQTTVSGIMSEKSNPDFKFIRFDGAIKENDLKEKTYEQRLNKLSFIFNLETYRCENLSDLLTYGDKFLIQGYEGIILRNPYGIYKFGRSTLNEGYLLKYKEFEDAEAKILASEPLMSNANIATIDNLGYTERSSCKANLVKQDMLGSWKVIGINEVFKDVIFHIGSGFTEKQRIEFWKNKNNLLNKIITYKYQKHGIKTAPRSPIFKGFRYE